METGFHAEIAETDAENAERTDTSFQTDPLPMEGIFTDVSQMGESGEILVNISGVQTAAVATEERIEFEEAFMLHHRTVFRAARSVVREAGLAEDVTQETFLRLHQNIDSIADAEMLRPWLIRVAINVAKNMVRGRFRANTRDENYVKETSANALRSVDLEYEDKEGVNDVVKTLSAIKEPLRSCLLLKQQGLSYKEIAASLDLKESSIGTYIARARAEFARGYSAKNKGVL